MLEYDEEVEYTRDEVVFIVEHIKEATIITDDKMDAQQVWAVVEYLVNKFSRMSGIKYNEVLDDLKIV